MKNKIQVIGLLSLLNLKMKDMLTVLVILSEQGGLFVRICTFFSALATLNQDSYTIKMGRLLSLCFPNQIIKLYFYLERFASNSSLSVKNSKLRESRICYALNSRIRICHYSTDKPANIPLPIKSAPKMLLYRRFKSLKIIKVKPGKGKMDCKAIHFSFYIDDKIFLIKKPIPFAPFAPFRALKGSLANTWTPILRRMGV